MDKFDTDIGKIYCHFNEEKQDYDMMRLVKIDKSGDNGNGPVYIFRYLDDNFRMLDGDDKVIGETRYQEGFDEIKKNWTVLKSDGIATITNIVAAKDEVNVIKDVVVLFFPNNPVTDVPEINQPYILARQGITNLFAEMAGIDEVGLAVSLDDLPAGYALSDFMENISTISSKLCHVYRTDTEHNLEILLDNEDTSEILKDLYDHAVRFKENTIDGYEHEDKEDDCIDGYCNNLKTFLLKSEFMSEFYNKIGIIPVDFEIKPNEPLDVDDRLYLATLCGGIKISKAVPMKFDYTINMSMIKMKYLLAIDTKDILYIIPYTESPEEITADELYNLTEDRTIKLQERLSKCIATYEKSIHNENVDIDNSDEVMNQIVNDLNNMICS